MRSPATSVSRSMMKRTAIIEAAKKIFLNQGFGSSSMDDIALQAQVSKKTVYHHFANKEVLFHDMLAEHWTMLYSKNKILFDDKLTVVENLKRFANLFLDFLYHEDTIDLFRILISESNRFPNLVENILVNDKAPFTRALILFLKEKNKSKELNITNPERSASYFMGLLKEDHFWPMMLGFVKTKKLKNKNALVDEAIEMFVNFYKVSRN